MTSWWCRQFTFRSFHRGSDSALKQNKMTKSIHNLGSSIKDMTKNIKASFTTNRGKNKQAQDHSPPFWFAFCCWLMKLMKQSHWFPVQIILDWQNYKGLRVVGGSCSTRQQHWVGTYGHRFAGFAMALRGAEREGWGGLVICSVVDPEHGWTKRYSCFGIRGDSWIIASSSTLTRWPSWVGALFAVWTHCEYMCVGLRIVEN